MMKIFMVATYVILIVALYVLLFRDMKSTIENFQESARPSQQYSDTITTATPEMEAKVADLKRTFDAKNNELASWAVTVFN